MPDRVVVCNTSPLLYLHQVGHLDLLKSLYGEILVPPAVRDELREGRQRGFSTPDVDAVSWIRIQPLRERSLLPAVVDLGLGEAEAIALALLYPGSLLILDDALGRRIAQLSELTFTGTLGILVRAKQAKFLQAVTPVVETLQETTMRLTPDLIGRVLVEAGE